MLARNTIANFLGQAYLILVGIVVLPLFLKVMGPEEFGLIGFFTLLNTWLQILTTGLSPTLARQVSVYQARAQLHSRDFRNILRSLEALILLAGLIIAITVFFAADVIQRYWLQSSQLNPDLVSFSIQIMGVISAMRLGVALYTSGLMGMERQVSANGLNVAAATLRFIGGLLVVLLIENSITTYFIYQAIVSVVELLVFATVFYRKQPAGSHANDPGFKISGRALRENMPFMLSVTYSAMLWLFITQFDKVMLSGTLSLEQFGYMSFVVVLANGVLRVGEPINQSFLPRLTVLISQKNDEASDRLYSDLTEIMAVLALTTSVFIAVFSEQIMMVLTGDETLVAFGHEPLIWFVLGNGVMVLSSLFFLLQTAQGDLRLHMYGGTISAAIQVPIMAYIALNHDVVTLGIAWFVIRTGVFAVMSVLVHRKFLSGAYLSWLSRGILRPLTAVLIGALFVYALDQSVFGSTRIENRLKTMLFLVFYLACMMTCASMGSQKIRNTFVTKLARALHQEAHRDE